MAGYEGYNKEDFEAIIPLWQHVWACPRFASGRFGYGRGSGSGSIWVTPLEELNV